MLSFGKNFPRNYCIAAPFQSKSPACGFAGSRGVGEKFHEDFVNFHDVFIVNLFAVCYNKDVAKERVRNARPRREG